MKQKDLMRKDVARKDTTQDNKTRNGRIQKKSQTNKRAKSFADFRLNQLVLRRLQKAAEKDSTVDLLSIFPTSYSERITELKKASDEGNDDEDLEGHQNDPAVENELPVSSVHDYPWLNNGAEIEIIHPLSAQLQCLISSNSSHNGWLSPLVMSSQILFQSRVGSPHVVLKISPEIVLKVIHDHDLREYTTLEYLQEHLPEIPVPRTHGVVRSGSYEIIFISYIPGSTLETLWPVMDDFNKISIRNQLQTVLTSLRSLPFPAGTPLGGVNGEGCTDHRRDVRRSEAPLWTAEEYDEFQFSNPLFGSDVYLDFLKQFRKLGPTKIVFSHGDFRMPNILATVSVDGNYTISGMVDWQFSGFYPDYYETTKATNCFSPNEDSDWYLFLPEIISPGAFSTRWLLDRIWDKHIN